ncbi:MAG TPA: hypothetical protein VJG83_06895 [archaeon]|nr:hypothetical protein [archaeon]
MKIAKEKCKQCSMEVQSFNMENHLKNHELEKAAAAKAAQGSTQKKD